MTKCVTKKSRDKTSTFHIFQRCAYIPLVFESTSIAVSSKQYVGVFEIMYLFSFS